MQNPAGHFSHQNRRNSSEFLDSVSRQNTAKLRSRVRKIFAAKISASIKGIIYFFYLVAMNASASSLGLTLEEYANKPVGHVIFLRHAFAPGLDANGEPAKFKIDDCSTQRNLNSTGREQAITIGKKFSENGIKFGFIYSSLWCRCLETAQLLDLGKVYPEVALNSGFKGLFKQEETLTKLRKILELLRNEKSLILMITHRGVISAITGVNVKSGGVVAYDVKSKTSKIISIE